MKKLGNNEKYAILGTVLVHGIIIAVLLLCGFAAPKIEFPEPEGILVEFGELVVGDDSGEAVENHTVEPTSVPTQNAVPETPVISQNVEPAPISVPDNKPTIEDVHEVPEISPEEQERIRKEQEFREKMDKLTGQLGSNQGDGSQGSHGNSSEGATSGHAGNPNGTKSTNTKGTPGNPYGNKDAANLVKPNNTTNCNNPITLTVTVNSQGNVVEIKLIETALSEQSCIDAAKAAAKRTTFPPDSKEIRYAKITYEYSVSKK